MDVAEALADMMEVSSQVETAVVLDELGDVLGAIPGGEAATAALARAARDLLAAAERVRVGPDAPALTQLEAATARGSVFVVRDGARAIVATTAAAPTVGLVFYDLKTCLRALAGDGDGDAAA